VAVPRRSQWGGRHCYLAHSGRWSEATYGAWKSGDRTPAVDRTHRDSRQVETTVHNDFSSETRLWGPWAGRRGPHRVWPGGTIVIPMFCERVTGERGLGVGLEIVGHFIEREGRWGGGGRGGGGCVPQKFIRARIEKVPRCPDRRESGAAVNTDEAGTHKAATFAWKNQVGACSRPKRQEESVRQQRAPKVEELCGGGGRGWGGGFARSGV